MCFGQPLKAYRYFTSHDSTGTRTVLRESPATALISAEAAVRTHGIPIRRPAPSDRRPAPSGIPTVLQKHASDNTSKPPMNAHAAAL